MSSRWAILLGAIAACTRNPERLPPLRDPDPAVVPNPAPVAEPADGAVAAARAPTPDAGPPVRDPLGGVPWQFDLVEEVDGGAKAATKIGVVSVPLGARERRPIVVAMHGGSDQPGWACGEWRGVTNAYPFIVCPRGSGSESALYWASLPDTQARVARAIAATRKLFPTWIAEGPTVLVGFSMGATQAILLARGDPKTYRRVVIAESAYDPDPAIAFAKPWTAGGGERAIFLCTTVACEATYANAARNVARYGVPARLNIAGTNQHGIWAVVVRSMRRDWPWLVEGVAGWEGYTPAVESEPLPGKTQSF